MYHSSIYNMYMHLNLGTPYKLVLWDPQFIAVSIRF